MKLTAKTKLFRKEVNINGLITGHFGKEIESEHIQADSFIKST